MKSTMSLRVAASKFAQFWGQRMGVAPLILLAALCAPLPNGAGAHIAGIPSLCFFNRFTGLPCPGCGITRSLVCAGHFFFADAFVFHPLGPPILAVLALFTVYRLMCGKPLLSPRYSTRTVQFFVAAFFGVWFARLFHFLPSPP